MESIFRNIDSLEESQSNITKLLDQLDRDTRQIDNSEVGFLLTGMEEKLGQFSDNHYELQREIEELLESSRRGVLSHEKLTDMVNAEQVRTQYLANIVNSLKTQIEGLFTKLVTTVDEADESVDTSEIVEQVSGNVNLLWKSVDSLSKLIGSPTKKLEYNIQKIDSEVIVHLNKTMHLHDKSSVPTIPENGPNAGNFAEKMEKSLKAVRSKKTEKRDSLAQKGGNDVNNSSNINSSARPSIVNKNTKRDGNSTQVSSSGNNNSSSNSNNTYNNRQTNNTNNNNNNNVGFEESHSNSSNAGNTSQRGESARKRRDSKAQLSPPPPSSRSVEAKQLPPEQVSVTVEVNRKETFQTAAEVAEEKKKLANEKKNAGKNVPVIPISHTDEKGRRSSITPLQSSRNDARTDGSVGDSSSHPIEKIEEVSSHPVKSKGRRRSKGSEAHLVSNAEKDALSNLLSHNESSSKQGGKKKGGAADKSVSKKDSAGSGFTLLDDEGSLNSLSSYGDKVDQYPKDRKSLLRIIEEKEALLKEQKATFDVELKKHVKEYLRSHGIGFGPNQQPSPTPGNIDNSITNNASFILNDSVTFDASNSVFKNEKSLDLAAPSSFLSEAEDKTRKEQLKSFVPGGLSNTMELNSPSSPATNTLRNNNVPMLKGIIDNNNRNTNATNGGLQIHTDATNRTQPGSGVPTPVRNIYDDSADPSHYPSGRNTNKTSKVVSRVPSRVPSREGLTPGKQRYGNHDYTSGGGAVMSRQASWKISRSPSYQEELSEIKTRLRQLHQLDQDLGGSNGEGDHNNDHPYHQQRQEMLEEIIEKIYMNVRTGQTVAPIDWNLIRLIGPNSSNNQKKEEKTTSTDDLEEWIHKKLYELPIFDNQNDILVTRSYKIAPEQMTFEEKLQLSTNPLFLLYQQYSPYLSQLQKERLFYASLLSTMQQHNELSTAPTYPVNANAMPKMDVMIAQRNRSHIIAASHHILTSSKKLQDECNNLLPLVNAIESLVNDSVQIVKTIHRSPAAVVAQLADVPNIQYLLHSLTDLFRLMGVVEAQEITINLRIAELRSFFESIQAINIKELGILLQESKELNEAYSRFSETQGSMLEVHRRLTASKDRSKRYQLVDFLVEQQQQLRSSLTATHPNAIPLNRSNNETIAAALGAVTGTRLSIEPEGMSDSYNTTALPTPARQAPPGMIASMSDQQFIKTLQDELKSAEEEIEDLEMEIITIMKEKDKTPSAILFFSLLHDPSFIPNLQQLILQFKSIKQFLDYSENMDYITLRKRLQVCLVIMPSVDKLIEKYSKLYKQWSYYRLNWFAERKVRGSASDGMSYCPLCYNDIHDTTTHPQFIGQREGGGGGERNTVTLAPLQVTTPLASSAGGGKRRGGGKDSSRIKRKLLTQLQHQQQQHQQDINGLLLPVSQSTPFIGFPSNSTGGSSQIHKIPTLSKSLK